MVAAVLNDATPPYKVGPLKLWFYWRIISLN